MANTQPKFSVAIRSDAYKKLINDTLGDKEVARRFVAEISTVVAQNYNLQSCDAKTILSAGLLAQTMNLPLSPSLGFCYIIPYKKAGGLSQAQFQIGYKGLIQLAQRSGQFKTMGVRSVHKGENIGQDENGDDVFKFSHEFDNEEVIGFYAYFSLLNGFKKSLYMTTEETKKHAKTYSRSYGTGKQTDLWTNSFEFMGQKTVLKKLLNTYAPLSTDLQKTIQADQAVIKEDGTYDYVDNGDDEVEEKKTSVSNSILPQADDNGEVLEEEVEKEEVANNEDYVKDDLPWED